MAVSFVTESRSFLTGQKLAVLPAYDRQGEWKLNDIGELRFSLPQYHPAVTRDTLYPIRDEIWLWRQETGLQPKLIFAGPLMTVAVDNGNQKLSCTANSLEAHLTMRVIETYYTVDGQGDAVIVHGDPEAIAWYLIDRAQSSPRGKMRLIKGHSDGGGADTTYTWLTSDFKPVFDAINDDLAKVKPAEDSGGAVASFDFWIDPSDRSFNTYYPVKGVDKSDKVILQFGSNIQNYSNQVFGSTTATQIIMRGGGDPPLIEVFEDIIASEKYGLRQKVISWNDSSNRGALQGAAQYNASVLSNPHEVPNLTVRGNDLDFFDGSINLGDIVRVKIHDGYTDVDRKQRFVGFQLTIGSEDNETYNLYMNDLREVLSSSTGGVTTGSTTPDVPAGGTPSDPTPPGSGGDGGGSTTPPSDPTTRKPTAPFFIDPNSQAADHGIQVPGDRAAIQTIIDVGGAFPVGDWLGAGVTSAVAQRANAAKTAGSTVVFEIYAIPHRDITGGFSSGGFPTADAYKAFIQQVIAGVGSAKAVIILEPDSLGQIDALTPDQKIERYMLLNYAVTSFAALANTSVYLDGTNSGWLSAADNADKLMQAGIAHARGFATNVSNFYTTAAEISRGNAMCGIIGGNAHFVVDTSRNGQGPDPGNDWCNPSGRGLGKKPTITTGAALCDALLWIKTPGASDGTCNGGPAAGQWFQSYAVGLISRAVF